VAARRRLAKSLKRTAETRPELRTIVVFTEGKKAEPEYLTALQKLPHIAHDVSLNLEIQPEHGVPLTLVQSAVRRNEDQEIDECWCIFDVEWPQHHPNLQDAVSLAHEKGINLAISNPCFELWLILHHEEYCKFATTRFLKSACKAKSGQKDGSIDPSSYMPLRWNAASRARKLDKMHEQNGTRFPQNNPSTGMHLFLQSLERTSRSY
jgi:hypothetical protein